MKQIILLIVYLLGGVALYPFIEILRAGGDKLNILYSWILIDSGSEMAVYQLATFAYASVFHLAWAVMFSESAKIWVSKVTSAEVVYLFLRLVVFLVLSLLILGLVGVSIEKRPYSGFHMYFSVLFACVLLGGWSWSIKDFYLAVFNCSTRRVA